MPQSIDNFLQKSPIAERIKLSPQIVIHRTKLSANDLVQIKNNGNYGPIEKKEKICELEIDKKIFALGKIVKKSGEYFFKVLQLLD